MSDDALTSTISRAEGPALRPSAPRATITVVHPPELAATRVALAHEGALTVGRHASAEGASFAVKHPTVSRVHFALGWSARQRAHVARDLQSHNGLFANGAAVRGELALDDGAVLRAGDVLFVYERAAEFDDARVATAAARVSTEALPGRARVLDALRVRLCEAADDAQCAALLQGETGVGKEHLAREIHRLSARRGAFVALNAAALTPALFESQLFGHERGAFTGASAAHEGAARAAAGGTLFLDEIGEIPLELQAKLLRLLQEREVHPLGAARPVRVDVRFVAATNRDLRREVQRGAFRADLFARLSLRALDVAPLRARRVDLFEWVSLLGARAGVRLGFDADAAERLLCAPWQTNLRGLERLVRALDAHAARGPVSADALPAWVDDEAQGARSAAREAGARVAVPTREAFIAAYEQHGGSVHALARLFERDRRQIYRWIDAYGLRPPGDRARRPGPEGR